MYICVCVCVCVCVCERERVCECVCECVSVRAREGACVARVTFGMQECWFVALLVASNPLEVWSRPSEYVM